MSTAAEEFDIDALRQRLARAEGPAYWRCLEEAAGDAHFQRWLERERPRLAGLWQAPAIDRRAVLKLMAASLALAGVTACGQAPEEAIVPYVQMPESLLPGVPRHYASSLEHAGEGIGVLVETREGRPVKVEGNPAHPTSRGATDTYAQAALLSLYDPDRSRGVRHRGTPASWDALASGCCPQLEFLWVDASVARGRTFAEPARVRRALGPVVSCGGLACSAMSSGAVRRLSGVV